MTTPAIITAFESCQLPKQDWNHVAHLDVAAWYVFQAPDFEAALSTFRDRLKQFNRAQGIMDRPGGGYHETLTHFWVRQMFQLKESTGSQTYAELLESVREMLSNQELIYQYYSHLHLWSPAARRAFVPPDLKIPPHQIV